jgi:hypothetical protein
LAIKKSLSDFISGEMSELAEGARLEIVCAVTRHRGFESLSLRHINKGFELRVARYGFMLEQFLMAL